MHIRILFSIFTMVLFLSSYAAHAEENYAPEINRALFALEVIDKEPSQAITFLQQEVDHVLFFSEVSGLAGHTIRHRWLYDNKVYSEVSFNIGADHWRVWSSKRMSPSRSGTWTAQLLDDYDNILATRSFNYLSPPVQNGSY
ncbi:MAG: DUF2914 domain-containing protein [Mariprofundaceae bacterium]|nr:DUF2914 domain-containing protein [Mariprofundaceae bacterium]